MCSLAVAPANAQDLSLEFSGRSAAAGQSQMPEGLPSSGAQMLVELLVGCPLLQCLSITSLIGEDKSSGLLVSHSVASVLQGNTTTFQFLAV